MNALKVNCSELYGIGGTTLKWIDSFLCVRKQRVVVNGVKANWALVGCLTGHVLGPLQFSLVCCVF